MVEWLHAAIDCEGWGGCHDFAVGVRANPFARVRETLSWVEQVMTSSNGHLAAGRSVDLSGDVGSFRTCEEDKDRRHLGGLRGTPEERIVAKVLCTLGRQGRRNQRGPHRAGSDGVHSNSLLDGKTRQRASEAGDGCLGRRIDDQARGWIEGLNRCSIDN